MNCCGFTLVAFIPPFIQKLAKWSQDANRRRELQDHIQGLGFLRKQIAYCLQVHRHLCLAQMGYELKPISKGSQHFRAYHTSVRALTIAPAFPSKFSSSSINMFTFSKLSLH